MQKSSVLKPLPAPAMASGRDRGARPGRRRLATVAATAACVAVLGLAGTACSGGSGGSGDKDSKDSAAASGKTDEDKAVEHRKCLRENGLKVPEPKGTGKGSREGITIGGDNKATVEKAIKACRDKAPKGMGDGKASPADKDKMVKFANCMRKHGVDVPMPEADGGMARAMPMPKGEAEKKKHEKAGKACEGEMR